MLTNNYSKPLELNLSAKSNAIDPMVTIESQDFEIIPSLCPSPCPPTPNLAFAALTEQQEEQQLQGGREHDLDSIWSILDSGMRQGCRHGEQLDRIENELRDIKRRLRER
jgi:hypothetical protein